MFGLRLLPLAADRAFPVILLGFLRRVLMGLAGFSAAAALCAASASSFAAASASFASFFCSATTSCCRSWMRPAIASISLDQLVFAVGARQAIQRQGGFGQQIASEADADRHQAPGYRSTASRRISQTRPPASWHGCALAEQIGFDPFGAEAGDLAFGQLHGFREGKRSRVLEFGPSTGEVTEGSSGPGCATVTPSP